MFVAIKPVVDRQLVLGEMEDRLPLRLRVTRRNFGGAGGMDAPVVVDTGERDAGADESDDEQHGERA